MTKCIVCGTEEDGKKRFVCYDCWLKNAEVFDDDGR
jgi:NMD protein affecting ribosome stability and mRNA decay